MRFVIVVLTGIQNEKFPLYRIVIAVLKQLRQVCWANNNISHFKALLWFNRTFAYSRASSKTYTFLGPGPGPGFWVLPYGPGSLFSGMPYV